MEFVTDRTEEDVLLGNEKGQYTSADLNRVESNVKELAVLAEKIAVYLSLTTKIDWKQSDQWMNATQAERYLGNVKTLASACGIPIDLPSSMGGLDWQKVNDIEKSLEKVYCRIMSVINTFHYSGEMFAGEETI